MRMFGDIEVPREGPGLVSVNVNGKNGPTASDLYAEHRRRGGIEIQFWEKLLSRGLRPT